jgi:hypothetical protein
LRLILAGGLLRAQVGQLEARDAAHGVQPHLGPIVEPRVEPPEAADGVPGVVQVVDRDLVQEAVGAQRGHRAEVADAAALAADLHRRLAGAEAAAADRHGAAHCAAGAEAAAAVQHGDAGDLAAEFGRDVPGDQLGGLHHGDVEGVGERAGQLIADRQAVDDEGHLVVGPARMDRTVGVLREAGERDQHRLEAAAGHGDRHPLDPGDGNGVPGAGRGAVDRRRLWHHLDGVGQRGEGQPDVDLETRARCGVHATCLDDEPGQRESQVVRADGEVGDFVAAGGVGDGLPLEPARRLPQGHRDARNGSLLFVRNGADDGEGRLRVRGGAQAERHPPCRQHPREPPSADPVGMGQSRILRYQNHE